MKERLYKDLVTQRKKCRRCSGLRNPAEEDLKQFDSDEIGPWSILHGDLNAKIMIIAQDWGDIRYYLNNSGLDKLDNPTMRTLEKLLHSIGMKVKLSSYENNGNGLFLTNAILCLKEGGLQGNVEDSWFENCASRFLWSQIEIVSPRIVIGMGQKAYGSILSILRKNQPNNFEGTKTSTFREAVGLEKGIELSNGNRLFAVYHCGNRILNTHRNLEAQLNDWRRIGKYYE